MKTVYQTDDGMIFDTADKAEAHELQEAVTNGAINTGIIRGAVEWIFLNYSLTKRKRGAQPAYPVPPAQTGWPNN